ncbi:MAG: hypothetical protein L3J92_00840 [Thermoplasmata archaeon]|nr:hypothetical protein [Thermoplasmata archaeon]
MVYIVLRRASYITERSPGILQPARRSQRVAASALAFAVADLLVGFTAFSSITLAALWMFAVGWIQLHSEFLAHGSSFGAAWQLGLAWFGALAALPLIGLTLYLATRALSLPRRVYYMVRGGLRPTATPDTPKSRLGRSGVRTPASPSYLAGFWTGPR